MYAVRRLLVLCTALVVIAGSAWGAVSFKNKDKDDCLAAYKLPHDIPFMRTVVSEEQAPDKDIGDFGWVVNYKDSKVYYMLVLRGQTIAYEVCFTGNPMAPVPSLKPVENKK